MKETINQIFTKHNELRTAYELSQKFKRWYDYQNSINSICQITQNLHLWHKEAMLIPEFKSVIKMLHKHEPQIINFFKNKMTNAKAERLNGKIQRFFSANYGLNDEDFFLYRTAMYFS